MQGFANRVKEWIPIDPPTFIPVQAAALLLNGAKEFSVAAAEKEDLIHFVGEELKALLPYMYCYQSYRQTRQPFTNNAFHKLVKKPDIPRSFFGMVKT